MGDSPVFNTIKNVAGYGVGTLAALDTIKGGGLGNYLMNRQRLMSDPGFRSTLAGSPFAAGVFGVSGATGPAPAAPSYPAAAATGAVASPGDGFGPPAAGGQVAAPGDAAAGQLPAPSAFNVPGYIPGTPRAWMPNLPPYDPEEAIKQQAIASQQIAIGAPDSFLSGIAKMQAGIMPTQKETDAVIGQAKDIQHSAGIGSTVGVKLPGMTVQIGSPYNIAPLGEEEFSTPEQARAAATAHGPGWGIGPTVHGGWRPIPPPTNEQLMPPAPGTAPALPGAATGPVLRGGPAASATIPNRTNNPGNIKDSAFAAAQPGYVGPGPTATDGGRFAVFNSPASGMGAMTNLLGSPHYQALTVDQAANRWSGGGYGGEVGAAAGIHPDRPMSSLSDAERAQLATSMARREGFTGGLPAAPPPPALPPPPPPAPAERGAAYAAAPPPGAQVMPTPAPAPAPTFDRDAVVPHVEVAPSDAIGYPPSAPAVQRPPALPVLTAPAAPTVPGSTAAAATPPPPLPPGQRFMDPTGNMPLQTQTQQYQGGRTETYTAPSTTDAVVRMRLANAGVTNPDIQNPAGLANYSAQERANNIQQKTDEAEIQRTKRGLTEGEATRNQTLTAYRSALDSLLYQFPDANTRAYYLGFQNWAPQSLEVALGIPGAEDIARFRAAIAPLAPGTFTDAGRDKTLLSPDVQMLRPVALSGHDSSMQFEANLQALSDRLDDQLALGTAFRGMSVDQVTPQAIQAFRDQLQQQRLTNRLAAFQPAAAPSAPAPEAPPPPTPASSSSGAPWAPTATWTVP
jgi:hypothetical protein